MTIAVYIPSCNQKAYLREAIDSVLAQTRRADQIIIVDDASSDGSQEMIRSYASRHPDLFTTIFHERNRGIAVARNNALNAVRCDLVTYVDGDDVIEPEKLELEADLLGRDPRAEIAFSNHGYMSEDGRRPHRLWADPEPPPQGNVFVETVTRRYPQNTLFRNELLPIRCLREVGLHDPSLSTFEDYDLRIRLTKQYRTAYCPIVNGWVREHSGPRLSKSACEEHFRNILKIIEKNRPLWSDLPADQVRRIEAGLDAFLARLARRSAVQLSRSGQRRKACAAWKEACRRGGCPLQLGMDILVSTLPEWGLDDILPCVKRLVHLSRRLAGGARRSLRALGDAPEDGSV